MVLLHQLRCCLGHLYPVSESLCSSPGSTFNSSLCIPWEAADNGSNSWVSETPWEIQSEFLAPVFSLAKPWLLQAFEKLISGWEALCLSIPLCVSVSEVK